MKYSWFDLVGNVGVAICCHLSAAATGKAGCSQICLFSAECFGRRTDCASLLFSFNMSAFMIEISWVAISLFGIYRCFRSVNESVK